MCNWHAIEINCIYIQNQRALVKTINNAIIMAAGRGTRMLPLTKKIPKAMMTYKNSTLIANGIKYLKKNIDNIHITVGHKGSILAKHVIENNVSTIINTNKKCVFFFKVRVIYIIFFFIFK